MHDADFIVIATRSLNSCVREAQAAGWTAGESDRGSLVSVGLGGKAVKLSHPDAPFDVVLVRSRDDLRVTAAGRGTTSLSLDPELAYRIIDDAPVVAWLVNRLEQNAA